MGMGTGMGERKEDDGWIGRPWKERRKGIML